MIAARSEIDRAAVASHYDELDQFYREIWGDHVHHGLWLRGNESRECAVEQLAELVLEKAHVAPGVRVCDIGCGYGATSRLMVARGADVTAITISPAQFSFAQEQLSGDSNPRFILGDWLENELPDGAFGAAIAIESSEHMPDLGRFFQQAHRVLRVDGRLIVCAWLAADQAGRVAQKWLLEPICREGRMPQMGNASDYEMLGQRAGFVLQNFDDITKSIAPTWPAIVRRLLKKFFTNPRYLRFVVNRHAHNRIFGLTILRLWIAYRFGAMRYGVFAFVKT